MSGVQVVQVDVSCPSCGADGYEFVFAPEELNAEVSVACDECPRRIAVSVDVTVQAVAK